MDLRLRKSKLTVFKLRVKLGGSSSRNCFKVKPGSQEVGDAIGEGEMRIKHDTKIAHRGVGGESER